MLKLDNDIAPVLPEDPNDDVRNEGHDEDEETEEPDRQRGENDGIDSGTEFRIRMLFKVQFLVFSV